jgi:hypothetical protein
MHRSPRRPCGSFAGLVPATRGTRPLPLDPLPSPPFRSPAAKDPENNAPDQAPEPGWNPKARQNDQRPSQAMTVASALPVAEEALACKASLRWHVDSALQAERQGD